MRFSILISGLAIIVLGCGPKTEEAPSQPSVSSTGWVALFNEDLSNAVYPEGIWTVEDGVLTASEDQAIWSRQDYTNFELDLEFKTADGTNSGIIVYASDTGNWIPNSVEIQIADDFAEKWASSPKTWQCAAIFGHKAASESRVKRPGQWNRITVKSIEGELWVELNGAQVNHFVLADYTSAKINPDGSEIPNWLSKPKADLPATGKIGFQGKHAGAPIWFRTIKIREL